MCLGTIGKIIKIDMERAQVNISGSVIEVSVKMLKEAAEGDFVMIHAGYAISKVDAVEAEKMDELAKEISGLMSEG